MPRSSYWTRTIPILADETVRITQKFKIDTRGRAIDFSLVLFVKIDGRWHRIKRCDATPLHGGVPHCHIYLLRGDVRREIVGAVGDNLGVIVSEIIRDIRQRLQSIIDNYRHSR
jgi:hypothetical protein